jgi:hypothetical protein
VGATVLSARNAELGSHLITFLVAGIEFEPMSLFMEPKAGARATMSGKTGGKESSQNTTADRTKHLKLIGDIVSILGAVILFFSWIITNTLQQNYLATKAGAQRAEADARLYQVLRSLRQEVEGVAALVVDLRNGLTSDRRRSQPVASPAEQRHDSTVLWVDSTNLNARQIDWGYQACAIDASTIAKAVPGNANAIEKLEAACEELRNLQVEKDRLFDEVRAFLGTRTLTEGAEDSIRDLIKAYRDRVLPKFAPALRKSVEAGNVLREQMRSELAMATTRASQASSISFFTYILGTLLVLGGRLAEKMPAWR